MAYFRSRTLINKIEEMLVDRAAEPFSQVAPDLIQWFLDEDDRADERDREFDAAPKQKRFHRIIDKDGFVIREWNCLYSDSPTTVRNWVRKHHSKRLDTYVLETRYDVFAHGDLIWPNGKQAGYPPVRRETYLT
jgi:hypothetical protein